MGIFQARILEWVAFPFSRESSHFPNPGMEPRSPTLQVILYHLSHRRSPRTLEWVACPFSRGSSQPTNQTRLSCIAGRFWGLGFLHAKLGMSEISYYNEKDLVFFNFSEHFIKKNKTSHVMSIVQWIHVYYFPSFTIIKIIINIFSCLLLPLCLWTIWELVQNTWIQVHIQVLNKVFTLFSMFILRTGDPLYNHSTLITLRKSAIAETLLSNI